MDSLILVLFFQVILESFPISSSGHLFFLKKFFQKNLDKTGLSFVEHFSHVPTFLIIAAVFWKEWTSIFLKLIRFDFGRDSYRRLLSIVIRIALLALVVCLITIFFYMILKIFGGKFVFLTEQTSVLIGFSITTLILLSTLFVPENREIWDFRKSVILGVAQGISLLPGISRLGTTYVAARWLGISSRRSLQISFLGFVPLIMGSAFEGCMKLRKIKISFELNFSSMNLILIAILLGFVGLLITKRLAYKSKFWGFGIYMFFELLILSRLI